MRSRHLVVSSPPYALDVPYADGARGLAISAEPRRLEQEATR